LSLLENRRRRLGCAFSQVGNLGAAGFWAIVIISVLLIAVQVIRPNRNEWRKSKMNFGAELPLSFEDGTDGLGCPN